MKQTPYFFLLPSILILAFTSLYPICYSIYYSFFNWRWGDEKDFIGWPLSKRIGGFHVEEKTLRYKPGLSLTYRTDLLVSELDVHPNEKGHQKITEFLYDRLG